MSSLSNANNFGIWYFDGGSQSQKISRIVYLHVKVIFLILIIRELLLWPILWLSTFCLDACVDWITNCLPDYYWYEECALVFLKKFPLASLKLIWEKEILCSWSSLISFWSSLSFTLVLHLYPMSKLLNKLNLMKLKLYVHIMPSGSFTLGLENEIFWSLTITILVIQAIHE